ncbi:MAG: DUF1302 family protein [Candidatus Binatia bacterium]
MGRIVTFSVWWGAVAILSATALTRTAGAFYLDEGQNISLRARIYSQAAFRLNDSQTDTVPSTKRGQLIQHRNFVNPELDAKLTSYTSWMKGSFLDFLAPDDFRFRVAGWGFYDGIYDYGPTQFNESQKRINATYPDLTQRTSAFFLEGPRFDPQANTLGKIFPGAEVQHPRDIYATQRRVNELYLSYSKGPVFLRLGRQAISWGESDTIALLDQNNPFDVTLGAPGVFEDVEESRIPLWTLRGSLNLFDTWGPLSSGFVEAYWVPGDIDNNTGILPILGASPFSARGKDPQLLVNEQAGSLLRAQFVLFDHVPKKEFENSRWGVRLQTVVNRFFTVSTWFYTHFPNGPVPRSLGLTRTAQGVSLFTTETVHKLTSVIGASNTFFLEPLDTIVRMEAEYFDNEPAFIPEINLGITQATRNAPLTVLTACNNNKCKVPRADFLRWELGFDRFFFFRPLNPTNSFIFTGAIVGSWNLDETSHKDFRFSGQKKPGTPGTSPDDFVQLKVVEAFAQIHLQSDYLHGRFTPGITYIQNARGTYAILPTLSYRWTDWLLFDIKLIHIGGEYQQLGFFRDRDEIATRVTYQLN